MGILSLVPFRDWLYGGIIVAVSIFAGVEWHRHNVAEQALGAAQQVAADTRVATAAKTEIAADTAAASTTETSNAKTYDTATAAPVKPIASLVCQRAAEPPSGGKLPEAGTGSASGTDQPASDSGVGPAFDPVPALLARAHAADAQIVYLQGRILELETQMKNSP